MKKRSGSMQGGTCDEKSVRIHRPGYYIPDMDCSIFDRLSTGRLAGLE